MKVPCKRFEASLVLTVSPKRVEACGALDERLFLTGPLYGHQIPAEWTTPVLGMTANSFDDTAVVNSVDRFPENGPQIFVYLLMLLGSTPRHRGVERFMP